MKRELRIGESQLITISNNGAVTVSNGGKMNITEIANLFGIFYQTVKSYIRATEKSGIAQGGLFDELYSRRAKKLFGLLRIGDGNCR